MALFLNKMFFGQRAYGVAASQPRCSLIRTWAELNIAEAATLAGVLPAPSRYNPVSNAENAQKSGAATCCAACATLVISCRG